MMRSWTAIAVVFAAIFAATSCNDYGNTFQGDTGAFLSFISPANISAGGPDLTITLTGNGFVVQTYVTWDQAKLKTCVVTTTAVGVCAPANDTGSVVSVTAVVPAADTAKSGKHFIQTQNPYSGTGQNGLSNPVAFFVNPPANPLPTVSTISPNSAPAGSTDTPLTVTGTNFLLTSDPSGGSLVRWNTSSQTNLTITNITSTQITATIPAALLAASVTATVTVYNAPAPPISGCINCTAAGGGTSNGATFTVGTGSAAVKSAAAVEEETPAISLDGRYVAYAAEQNGNSQIFARDTCQGADSSCQPRTMLISAALDGTPATDDSHAPSMSSDGRYVAFSSAASNLTADITSGRQVYLRDTCFGAAASCTPSTQLVSTDPSGNLGGTESILPSVSTSGRYVAFLAVAPSHSASSSAAAGKSTASSPNSGYRQVFVRDTCLGASNCAPKTTRISLQPGDASGTATKPAGPAISGTANHVALANASTATLFTHSIPVDDGVFLALTKNQ
ncbi:MAG TPA: hypothetical protein VKH15_06700 [Candidatus Acidoferrum sp.]|nr:hypothetical protein [Candidatus Acidoferrum sp.]